MKTILGIAKWIGLAVAVLVLIGTIVATALNSYYGLVLARQVVKLEVETQYNIEQTTNQLRQIRNEVRALRREVRELRDELESAKQRESARQAAISARIAAAETAMNKLRTESLKLHTKIANLRADALAEDREVYKNSYRSVVRIRAYHNGWASQGAGFVVNKENGGKKEKVILTVNHLIDGNPQEIRVDGFDGLQWRATVRSADADTDLAELVTEGPLPYPVLEFADPSSFAPGDPSFFIGHPVGFEWSFTKGVISAIGEREGISSFCKQCQVIQTDAEIGPGYSGSPGLNSQGEVMGIIFFTASQNGISFAMLAAEAQRLLNGTKAP